MLKRFLSILSALCLAGALLASPAFADEVNPDGSASTSSEAAANEAEGAEGAEPAPAGKNIIETVQEAYAPFLSVGVDSLFKRQYDWVAVENLDFESANEDGSLSEWQTDWFISHDWSDYGMAIAGLEPGDAVTVNGQTILILGREQWPRGAINWDIYDVIGWDKVVFQTCLGDDAIWIAYGVPVHPTPEFLAAHPAA